MKQQMSKLVKALVFCEIDINFPFNYALFTNNHALDESNNEIDNTIHFEYLEFQK